MGSNMSIRKCSHKISIYQADPVTIRQDDILYIYTYLNKYMIMSPVYRARIISTGGHDHITHKGIHDAYTGLDVDSCDIITKKIHN